MSEQTLLDELALLHGILPSYYDNFGQFHETSRETKRAILSAMGIGNATDEDLQRELTAYWDNPWRHLCDPVLVVRHDTLDRIWSIRLPADEGEDGLVRARWEIRDEAGALLRKQEAGPNLLTIETRILGDRRHVRFELPLPEGLGIGYYELAVYAVTPSRFLDGLCRLIIVPEKCFIHPTFSEGNRTWGLALQLYALRSAHNWGVGDFTDLDKLVEWAARDLKAGIIGLNPLHALKNSRPYHISPYSPDSRLYLNMLYLDVERIPDYQEVVARWSPEERATLQQRLQTLRDTDVVDYDQVANVKRDVLERCFALFEERHCGGDTELQAKTARGQAFHDYVRNEGALLEAYAVFQAIAEAMQREHKDMWVWQQWPEPYRDPTSEAVATFRQTHRHEIQFHQYVQWMASEQLGAVAARTRESGMPIGLFHDLALGSDRSGSDAWVLQDVLTLGVDAGCPPDAFATQGQNWGLPPINPRRLQATGYNVFVDLLRHNMRTGGALRMDHVMGLFRLFWIPHGLPPSAGAYVRYPVEDLLGILALESVRNRTMVIGEDLGTVPNEVRERLAVARVLSYRVLYFERWEDGTWKAPETYPTQALAVVTTHDLPSLAGFWIGKDIEERARLGFYRDQDAQRVAWEERRLDKIRIWNALKAQHLLPAGATDDPAAVPRMTSELCTAIHAYLAQTPSWLVLASLDDAIGQVEQPNLPGTLDTHPNWSRKLSDTIENLRSDPRPRQMASSLGALRPLR